ncbi:MAG: sugar phosphate isomerase/epimerase family protein [Marinibacterium sp.]
MKLAVSNIGWSAAEDATIAPALIAAGADAIEVAPGRLFEAPAETTARTAEAAARHWTSLGLPIVSMQALLFGQGDLALLGSAQEQDRIVAYLDRIITLAGRLGCGPLVFGSPKNRVRGDLDFDAATRVALPALRRIGEAAEARGCVFCLEANATGYGCDFMTRVDEAAAVVRAVDHPGVRLILDTGNMAMENEDPAALVPHAGLIAHVHFSAPQLASVLPVRDRLSATLGHLRSAGYDRTITLEMRAQDTTEDLLACTSAVRAMIDGG